MKAIIMLFVFATVCANEIKIPDIIEQTTAQIKANITEAASERDAAQE